MEGGTYQVDLALEVKRGQLPGPELAKAARQFTELLPEGARLRGVKLPADGGVVEVWADVRAASPTEALHVVARAVELVGMSLIGPDAVGHLKHALVTHETEPLVTESDTSRRSRTAT